jgi:CBS domain-containing protein
MTIAEYCNRDVAIIEPTETILAAAKVMRSQHVGDVVVVERKGGEVIPIGIITDRDIVLELVAKEVALDSVAAGDMISGGLVTARAAESLADVVNHMRHHGVRRIPVVNEQGGLEGIFCLDNLLELMAEQFHDLVAILHKQADQEDTHRP